MTVRQRVALAIVGVALLQVVVALTLFSIAFGIGDGGGNVPRWLAVAVAIFGFPGLIIAPYVPDALGGIAAATAFGGLCWSLLLVFGLRAIRRRGPRVVA